MKAKIEDQELVLTPESIEDAFKLGQIYSTIDNKVTRYTQRNDLTYSDIQIEMNIKLEHLYEELIQKKDIK